MDAGDRKLSFDRGPCSVEIADVSKRFGHFLALDRCSLSVEPGEILALLGPSGCGKTTLLNVLAGFEYPDQGSLHLGGSSIKNLAPHLRGVGMVFQNYALFPHLTVAGNISYGLRVLKLERRAAEARILDVLRLMKLVGYAERYPHELSGGQRQRVAVARAMVTNPRVLLMDEAFSALDRNLREAMQLEFSLLLRQQGITTVLVTHDQREAFTIADRIAVMEGGRILQVGSGEELYQRPQSKFVLDFLGTNNYFRIIAILVENNTTHVEAECGISCDLQKAVAEADIEGLSLNIRPEDLRLSEQPTAVHSGPPATVEFVSFQGAARRVVLRLDSRQLIADLQNKNQTPAIGSSVYLEFSPERALLMRN